MKAVVFTVYDVNFKGFGIFKFCTIVLVCVSLLRKYWKEKENGELECDFVCVLE